MRGGSEPGKRVVCTKCEKRRPIDAFQWFPSKNRYHSWCRECTKAASRARRELKKAAAVEAEKAAAAPTPKPRRTRRTREEVAA